MFTQIFRSMQESEASRIGRMAERVAEGSVDAQKQVDEYERLNPYTHSYYLADQGRPRAFNSFTCINSYFKGRGGGTGSSFQTARYYAEQASIRRAELLEQVSGSS
mmetsp:Transcript_20633/g.58516  ORF Transcript_20633/g.58516 Transcript_20633/m.58516 type:complete len:106 (+) Transcript_20633:91-408(+)